MMRDPLDALFNWTGPSELDGDQGYDHEELAEYDLTPFSQRCSIRRLSSRLPGIQSIRHRNQDI